MLEEPTILLCCECQKRLRPFKPPHCAFCGAPVKVERVSLCPECPKAPLAFERIRAAVDYADERVRNIIHAFKFEYRSSLAAPLSEAMAQTFADGYSSDEFDAVVAIPLHRRRLREREFNQSALLAAPLAEIAGLPLRDDLLIRKRASKPQSRLPQSKREKNVHGVFHAPKPDLARGQRILLVDDIFTTGGTVNEAARVLREAGARSVCVITLARAFSHKFHAWKTPGETRDEKI